MAEIDASILKQRQSLPLSAKIAMSQSRIRQWYEHYHGEVYISFSGGKDSTVMRDLIKRMYPDVPAVFVDTGLEYPEVRDLALKKADVVIRPKISFKKVLEDYGYPVIGKRQARMIRDLQNESEKNKATCNLRRTGIKRDGTYSSIGRLSEKWQYLASAPFKVSEKCCDVMKKEPFKRYEEESGAKPYIGTMASESLMRRADYIKHGCNAFDVKKPHSSPLGFWLEDDVLRYIRDNSIEYAACYGDIVEDENRLKTTKASRTGCMFCMFGVHLEKTPNRFQIMQKDYPKQYKYCMESLGIREVLKYINVPYENDITILDFIKDEGK